VLAKTISNLTNRPTDLVVNLKMLGAKTYRLAANRQS
jgi:hypothetical protein